MFSSVLSIDQATVINDPKISVIHWPLICDGSSEIYQALFHVYSSFEDPSLGSSPTLGPFFFFFVVEDKNQENW